MKASTYDNACSAYRLLEQMLCVVSDDKSRVHLECALDNLRFHRARERTLSLRGRVTSGEPCKKEVNSQEPGVPENG